MNANARTGSARTVGTWWELLRRPKSRPGARRTAVALSLTKGPE
jgi:hypothetical protein